MPHSIGLCLCLCLWFILFLLYVQHCSISMNAACTIELFVMLQCDFSQWHHKHTIYYCSYCNWIDFVSHRTQTHCNSIQCSWYFSMHHQSTKPLTTFERIQIKHCFVYALLLSDVVHLTRQLNVINVLHYYYIELIHGVVFNTCLRWANRFK